MPRIETNSACIACRFRRKKCDKRDPICTSCKELKIPNSLCVYSSIKIGLKAKDANVTLEYEKLKFTQLTQEYQLIKEVSAKAYQTANDIGGFSESNEHLVHYGAFSWLNLIHSEPEFYELMEEVKRLVTSPDSKIYQNLRDEKRQKYETLSDDDAKLNELQSRLCDVYFEKLYYARFLPQLLSNLENILPSYTILNELLSYYFSTNKARCTGYFEVDEISFRSDFERIFINDNGKVKLRLAHQRDLSIITLSFTIIGYSISILDQMALSGDVINFVLLYKYSLLLLDMNMLINSTLFSQNFHIVVETLQSYACFLAIHLYIPRGRYAQILPSKNLLNLRVLIIFAKMFRLDKNIDEEFPNETASYRRSLKSFWNFLKFLDLVESEQLCIPLKIPNNQLLTYKDYDSNLSRALNKITEIYSNCLKLENETIHSKFVDESLKNIKELQQVIAKEFRPLSEDMPRYLKQVELEDQTKIDEDIILAQSFTLKSMIYSMIGSIHHLIYKKTNSFKFKLLAMKYSFLVFSVAVRFFQALESKLQHNSNNKRVIFGVLFTNHIVFPYILNSIKKSSIFIFARLLEKIPMDFKPRIAGRLLEYNGLANKFDIAEVGDFHKFNFSDLEDFEIESKDEEFLAKFSALDDHRFVSDQLYWAFRKITNSLSDKVFNLNAMSLHMGFFILLKLSNITFYILHANDKPNGHLSLEGQEFDFNELFETSINTSSTKFDFNAFFKTNLTSLHSNNNGMQIEEDDLEDILADHLKNGYTMN